jgi:methyl-accepting chemotaxis protein
MRLGLQSSVWLRVTGLAFGVTIMGGVEAAGGAAGLGRWAHLLCCGTSALLLIGLVALPLLLRREVIGPLEDMCRAADAMAGGDLTVRITETGVDEVRQLARAVNHMATGLQTVVTQVQDSAQTVASTSQQLSAHSHEASRASEQVSGTIEALANGAAAQAQQVAVGADQAVAIEQALWAVTSMTEVAATAASDAAKAAHSGKSSLDEAVACVSKLHETVQSAVGAMERLGLVGDRIGEIVGMIKRIAAQTNLLALNAAIEAARSGEHGRGFAVVAAEVRTLSVECAASAEAITGMVRAIQGETQSAGRTIAKGDEAAGAVMASIGKAGEAIQTIVGSVSQADNEMGVIAGAIAGFGDGLRDVVGGLGEIAVIAQQSAAGAQQVSAAAQQQHAVMADVATSADVLALMSEELLRLTASFRVADGGTGMAVASRLRLAGG